MAEKGEAYEKATFAGGCFWCMVPPFQKLSGVQQVIAGYTGGHTEDPSYEEVCAHDTGHYEAVEILFDPGMISYEQLLEVFWRQIDPTDEGGQFADRGESYRTAIFIHTPEQERIAQVSKAKLAASGRFDAPVVTAILPAKKFYPAEEYHQNYHEKQDMHYKMYRIGSGRAGFLEQQWGKKA